MSAVLLLVSSCQALLDLDRYRFDGSSAVNVGRDAGAGGRRAVEPDASSGGSAPAGGTAGNDAAIDRDVDADAGQQLPFVPCEGSGAEVCDSLDNDCDDRIDPPFVCPVCMGFQLESRDYMFCSEPVDRGVAIDVCNARGMKLVWIDTANENNSLVSEVAAIASEPEGGGLAIQIGASDVATEGDWVWVRDGTSAGDVLFWRGNGSGVGVGGAYANWFGGEPNQFMNMEEDCALLLVEDANAGTWNDYDCGIPYPFVCEQR